MSGVAPGLPEARRWAIAGLLFASGFINYLDRAIGSVALPLIAADLHLGTGIERRAVIGVLLVLRPDAVARWLGVHVLEALQQRRVQITDQIAVLGDLRCGSITSTTGRRGKPNCHCHQPKDPGHGPNLRITYKVQSKTVTESLPDPAAVRKAEREIEEFRKYQALHKEFVEVNAQICHLRPSEPDTLSAQEEKRSKPSSKRPLAR